MKDLEHPTPESAGAGDFSAPREVMMAAIAVMAVMACALLVELVLPMFLGPAAYGGIR